MSGAETLLLALLGLALTGLPAVAAALLAVRLGLRDVATILSLALVASGAAAMLTFWAYFLPPSVGPSGAYLVRFGSVGLIAWSWPAAARERALLRRLAVPLGLWGLATLFVTGFGFMYGGTDFAMGVSAYRFATDPTPFAGDNNIPLSHSQWLFEGHPGPPPYDAAAGWQFSDRGPLQIGYVLSNRVFDSGMGEVRYETLGIALQQLWVVGMWALLLAARVSARTRGLAMVATIVSGVAIANAFYVWPKLLAGAFVLAALALVVSPGEPLIRRRPWTVVLLAACAGLALLAHSSTAFALVPVAALALWRGLPERRWLLAGVVALAVFLLPWLGYKQFVDPPSNRLEKLSLGGFAGLDDRGTLETLGDEYAEAGLAGTIDNKYRNFLTMAGGNPTTAPPPEGIFQWGPVTTQLGDLVTAAADGDFSEAISKAREIPHWHLFWALGLLPLALVPILLGRLGGRWRDGPEWGLGRFSLLFFAGSVVVFALLMFGNGASRAIPASLTFAVPLLGMAGLVAALEATYPRLTIPLVGANTLLTLLVYAPWIGEVPGLGFSTLMAVVAAASLAGVLAISLSGHVTRPSSAR
ncbi:MAG TPA: hypothetical protein VFY69_01035 [Solirubrobacterales bacterium]|nr:hypothetical protein [Solirubrobacterales bacterium]